jgi:hypothetical protein
MDRIHHSIELAEEFVNDEVDVDTSRFPQLTSVSREKMYYPPLAPTCNTSDGIHTYKLGVAALNM